jgi:hypothetical protein
MKSAAYAVICAGMFCGTAGAQLDNASLFGSVTDPSGARVASATVKIQNADTSDTVYVVSGGNGDYFAPVLPVGKYRVTISAAGFRSKVLDDVTLRAADRVRINVELEVGAVQDTVLVTGAAPLVDVGSSALGGVVGTEQLKSLPVNGRDVSDVLALVPGANLLATNASMSLNGVSMYRVEGAVKFLVDGADASRIDFDILDNDYGTSKGRITRAGMDGVEEVNVQAGSYSAEYGNSLSGVVNLISKSGGNEFHGSVFEYFRNEKLGARDFFNAGASPELRLNQFGGTLGGAIRRDKLFFFVNYEGVRQRTGQTYNVFVPTAAFRATVPAVLQPVVNLLPLPNGPVSQADARLANFTEAVSNLLDEDTGAAKVDYYINARHRVSVRYNGNGSLTDSYFGVARGQYNPAPGLLQLAKASYTFNASNNVVNELGFAVNRIRIFKFSAATQETRDLPIVAIGGGAPNVGPQTNDNRVKYTLYNWLDTLSWVRGRHQFKFGAQVLNPQEARTLLFQRQVTYQTLADFANNSPFSVGTLGQPESGMRGRYNDFFVQDDVQLSRRVTINAGLRYQYDTAPTEAHGQIANFNPATGMLDPVGSPVLKAPKTNFAPRLGIAWSPAASARTAVRASFGTFYAVLNPYLAQPLPNNVAQQASTLTRQQDPTLAGFPFPTITGFGAVTSFTALPKDYKGVYTEQWNFNIQQAIGADSMVQVGYIGNRGLHLNGTQNINRFFPGTTVRPYPQFGAITYYTNGNISDYNALQLTFRRRLRRGLTVNVNFRWAHSLDDTMAQFGSGNQDDARQLLDYSNSDDDVRRQLQFDFTYELPAPRMVPRWFGGGWQVNGITVMRAGMPVNVTCGCDSAGIGATTARPNYVSGVPLRPAKADVPKSQINFNAFSVPAKGTFGNLGRNAVTGPPVYNWDFSLFKNFRLSEHRTLQFRAEAFNLFNTPQFANPAASLNAPATFGSSTSTLTTVGQGVFGTNRQVEFALRVSF